MNHTSLTKVKLVTRSDPRWMKDSESETCLICKNAFHTIRRRKHHCRMCGKLICSDCSKTINTSEIPLFENYRYVVISDRWTEGRLCAEECPTEQYPNIFWGQQSKTYSAVMFASQNQGKTWSIYKRRGLGAVEKIIQSQAEYLPKPHQSQNIRICTECDSKYKNKKSNIDFQGSVEKKLELEEFMINDEVQAKWDDGKYYDAKIIAKTNAGYRIVYVEYEEEQNLPYSSIKKEKYITVEVTHTGDDDWGCQIDFNTELWEVSVSPGGQFDRLGIKTNDRIVARNNEDVDDYNYEAIYEKLMQGEACIITFLRDVIPIRKIEIKGKKTETVEITFQPGTFGMKFDGNRITYIRPDGAASKKGVCVGWTILEVNGEKQNDNYDEISEAVMKTYESGKPTVFLFRKERVKLVKFEPRFLGITFVGNTITKVIKNGQGYPLGVRPGWIIIMVNDELQPNIDTYIKQDITKTIKKGEPTMVLFQEAPNGSELDQYIESLSNMSQNLKKKINNLENEGNDARNEKQEYKNLKTQVELATKRKLAIIEKLEEAKSTEMIVPRNITVSVSFRKAFILNIKGIKEATFDVESNINIQSLLKKSMNHFQENGFLQAHQSQKYAIARFDQSIPLSNTSILYELVTSTHPKFSLIQLPELDGFIFMWFLYPNYNYMSYPCDEIKNFELPKKILETGATWAIYRCLDQVCYQSSLGNSFGSLLDSDDHTFRTKIDSYLRRAASFLLDMQLTITSVKLKKNTIKTKDLYVQVTAKQQTKKKIHKTTIKDNTLNLVWDECLHFTNLIFNQLVKIELFGKNKLNDILIGHNVLDIKEYIPKENEKSIEFREEITMISEKYLDISIKYHGSITKKLVK